MILQLTARDLLNEEGLDRTQWRHGRRIRDKLAWIDLGGVASTVMLILVTLNYSDHATTRYRSKKVSFLPYQAGRPNPMEKSCSASIDMQNSCKRR